MLGLLVKFLIGVLIIPIAYGVSAAFRQNFLAINELAGSLHFFIWGIIAYAALHLLFYKPTPVYVFGHEAVHAMVAWLFGGKITSFKVSKEGGSVTTDKTNTLIELSPYFIPVYTVLIALVYFLIASSYTVNPAIFIFLIGFTLAFHMISTIEVMKIRQPDIVKSGYFFSVVFVYALNIIVISMIFALAFPSFSLKKFFSDFIGISAGVYVGIYKQLFGV